MENAVIATSHASLASGVYSAIKMVAGSFDNIRIEEFKDNDNLEEFDQRLLKAYEDLKDFDNVIVLADLAGGTPFNRSVMSLGDKDNVRVLAGLNFASLYQALNSDGDIDLATKDIIETGRESLVSFENKAQSEDTEEDGI